MIKGKFFLIAFLFFCVATSLKAQQFRAGLNFGTVAADLAGINPNGASFKKAGLSFGGMLSSDISEKDKFRFEILYTQKGSLQKNDSTGNLDYYRLRLEYIEVPFIYTHQMHFSLHGKTVDRFAFELGMSAGTLIRIRQDNTFNNSFNNDSFKKFEIAAKAGLNISITHNLSANISYSNSIIPIVRQADLINNLFVYTFNKGNNMVFYFTLRYLFNAKSDES